MTSIFEPGPLKVTREEVRAWLRSLDMKRVRLPKSLDKCLMVEGRLGTWIVTPLITGQFSITPFPDNAVSPYFPKNKR